MKKFLIQSILSNQRGATAIVVGLCLFLLIGFGALAVDIGHLCVARNELQNAADAGALAGARFLYNNDGTAVNTGANQIARDAAMANMSERVPVDVNWTGGNEGDAQRGHWSFATRTFTPNDSLLPTELSNVPTAELDADTDFINAVKVTARRQATPIASYLAGIFGHESFEGAANATAYIGFAGDLPPHDVDQPIAICRDSLLNGDEYTCNVGRMINSGQDATTNETGGWTDFNQDNPCNGGTNAQEVKSLVCAEGNPEIIFLGENIATNGGDIQSAFNDLIQCWAGNTTKTQLWPLTLPVVDCGDQNNVGTCQELVGAVEVNIVWITGAGADPNYNDAPTQMDTWSNSDPDGEIRWNDFVSHFHLENVDGSPAPYAKKSIYFLPDCTPHDPMGTSGGENFGILAEIPKLVQ
ncbi:MAG: TadG family pilus assembly protein [Thermodesulfobacteriota bacterium]|nr:TadG family pilus assembly protein [Thermodesulfobacteriota bacterium]